MNHAAIIDSVSSAIYCYTFLMSDKYTATWVSHSSISDFLACPRAYFLNNVYRNPSSGKKISLMAPPLALGQIVHEIIESLAVLPVKDRFSEPLIPKFNYSWKKVSGEKGGFTSKEQEERYRMRGESMLKRVVDNPGPVANLAVRISRELPQYYLSDTDNIILCGKIDWLEYDKDSDSVKVLDFKTSKKEENPDSLQLPIYALLASNCQQRPVTGVSYWYLDFADTPQAQVLPDLDSAAKQILRIAKDIKLARALARFKCPQGELGCRACRPLEKIARGEGKYLGENSYGHELYSVQYDPSELESSMVL